MHRFYYTLIVFLGALLPFTSIVLAQHNVDSLLQVISEEGEESIEYVDQLTSTSFKVRNSYPEIAENLASKAIEISKKINYTKGWANALNNTGLSQKVRGNYGIALENYLHSRDLFIELKDSLGIATASLNIGGVYLEQFDTIALDYFKKAKAYYEKTNHRLLSAVLNNIGFHFYNQELYDSALIYLNQSLTTLQKRNDDSEIALQYNNIGYLYVTLDEYDIALGYLTKSINLWEKINDYQSLAMTYDSMGELFRKKGDFDQAVFYYKLGLSFAES